MKIRLNLDGNGETPTLTTRKGILGLETLTYLQ